MEWRDFIAWHVEEDKLTVLWIDSAEEVALSLIL